MDVRPASTNFVTRAECDAALPHILDAPKDDAPIDILCLRTGYGERSFPQEIAVSADRGIEGERWLSDPWLRTADGHPDPRIQVSILPRRVLDLCWRDRTNTPHPGDTVVTDLDMGEANMPAGTHLAVGGAVLEVSDKFNNACKKWQNRYGSESLHWLMHAPNRKFRLRGVLCRVVSDGTIQASDRIRVIR